MNPDEVETFNETVDRVAGYALIDLISGKPWRSIIWAVCADAAQQSELRRLERRRTRDLP